MLYYNFKSTQEFKWIFGTPEKRKSKILLSFLKNKELLHQARINEDYKMIHLTNLADMKKTLLELIQKSSKTLPYNIHLLNYTFGSSNYETDSNNGLCFDGNYRCVRYINKTSGKPYKMKAGKFLRSIIMETEYGNLIGEQAIGFLCEEFSRDWETYANATITTNHLTVSKEFWKIYSQSECEGDFHSCMTNKKYYHFYENAVECSAAYLNNEQGRIIARCIIYEKVYDEYGQVYRLAERQYSTDCSDILKRALVDALIREGMIDGYKTVGAGCNESRNFVDINGNSLAHKKFHIDCELDREDTCSYQDSFKFYDENERVAYNYETDCYDYDLSITRGSIENEENDDDDEEDENYDDYHETWTSNDLTLVFYHGEEMYCDEDRLEDFEYVQGEYYHKDDVSKCPYCGELFVTDKGVKSELTGELYCSQTCKDQDEEDFKDRYWFYSDYDNDYYENEKDITTFFYWNKGFKLYEEKTISVESYQRLFVDGKLFRFKGKAYDKINPETLRPWNY